MYMYKDILKTGVAVIVLAIGIMSISVLIVSGLDAYLDKESANECKQVAKLRGLEVVVIGANCYTKDKGKRVY